MNSRQIKKQLTRVLNEVNAARKILGLQKLAALPQGVPSSSEHLMTQCPLALGLPVVAVGEDYLQVADAKQAELLAHHFRTNAYRHDSTGYEIDLPPVFTAFVRSYDEGKFPSLVAR